MASFYESFMKALFFINSGGLMFTEMDEGP